MQNLSITLSDGTFNGAVTMQSSSKFHVVRAARSLVSTFSQDLDEPGLYFLLVDNNSIYVGQSGIRKVGERIMNTHRREIDSNWHTVIGFMCSERTITTNELLYMENALCEYVHKSSFNCLTTSPSRNSCNTTYRKTHYHLSGNQINACNLYIEDIKHYLSFLKDTMFNVSSCPSQPASPQRGRENPTYYKCEGAGASAIGYDSANGFTVCKDSLVSNHIGSSLSQRQKELRLELVNNGVILGNKFTRDFEFVSRATASNIILGRSSNANIEWKTD